MGQAAPGTITTFGGGGGGVSAGDILSVANWAALPTLGASDRRIASLPRLCGHGIFLASWNGSRWGVIPGQVVISDAGVGSSVDGYDLTAVGTTFVQLVAYTIPAGMIGNGEEWGCSLLIRNNGVYVSGNDAGQIRFADLGSSGVLNQSTTVTSANRVARGEGRFARFGTTLQRSSAGTSYTNQSSGDQTLDLSVARVIEAGMVPGAATNTMRLRQWSMGRVA